MAHVKQYNVDAPYLNVQCRLGEAPHYSEKLNEFRFLDIDNKQMLALTIFVPMLLFPPAEAVVLIRAKCWI